MARSKSDRKLEDSVFLAENFGIAPQDAAALVSSRDEAGGVEDRLREKLRSPDDATADLVADSDETRLKPVLRGRNRRSGGG